MAKILHASIDENSKAKGGSAGDQTGKEVCIATFNADKGWTDVLRPTKTAVANKMIKKGKKLCNSNLVGYDQNQRNTLHTQMKKNSYNAADYIKSGVKTETDCSAFMTCLAIGAGAKLLEYETSGNAPTTSTMVTKFVASGLFTRLAYTNGMSLKAGDILVKKGSHTCLYLG